jgi:hypothetical protein
LVKSQNDTLPLSLTKKYCKGEFKNDPSIHTDIFVEKDFPIKKIAKNAILKFEELYCDQNEAVVAVSIQQDQTQKDIYLYWIKDNDWKIKSFKSFRMPGVFYVILEKYKGLDDDGITVEYNKTIAEIKRKNPGITSDEITESIGSLDELILNIKIMRLTVASDSVLLSHFEVNKQKFNDLLAKIKENVKEQEAWKYDRQSIFASEMKEILISSISNIENSHLIHFIITGIIDNSVGYFYCQDPLAIPNIVKSNYIMIRAIKDGWYLYKTD